MIGKVHDEDIAIKQVWYMYSIDFPYISFSSFIQNKCFLWFDLSIIKMLFLFSMYFIQELVPSNAIFVNTLLSNFSLWVDKSSNLCILSTNQQNKIILIHWNIVLGFFRVPLHFIQQREKNQACPIDLSEDDYMIDNEEVAKKIAIPGMKGKDNHGAKSVAYHLVLSLLHLV